MTRAEIEAAMARFEEARPRLQAAIDRGDGARGLDYYRDEYLSGRAQLWHTEGYSALTQVLDWPNMKVVAVILAGGNLEALLEDVPDFEQFTRIVGARRLRIDGRRGWVRVLKEHGFAEESVTLGKEVTP